MPDRLRWGDGYMTVVYFGSREIYQDFNTAIRSLLAHNEAEVITITEDDNPFPDLPVRNINWKPDGFNDLNLKTKWKQFGVVRSVFTKLLPEYDRILSIDCDTIVTGDLAELWNTDMKGNHVAMVRERVLQWEGRPYYNNGICLMDLKQMREDGVDDLMIKELNTRFHRYVCQDVMQMYLRILDLPSTWNASKFTSKTTDPKIIHYADRTDWRGLPEVQAYR